MVSHDHSGYPEYPGSCRTDQTSTDRNKIRSSLHIHEDGEQDYGYRAAHAKIQVTTPTLQQVGSDTCRHLEKRPSLESGPDRQPNLQFKAASTSAIIPATHVVRNISTATVGKGIAKLDSGTNARKGIRIYQPSNGAEAEEGRVLYNQSEHQSMALPASGGLVRSQSAINRQGVVQSRNGRPASKGPHHGGQGSDATNDVISMSSFMPSQHLLSMDTGTQNGAIAAGKFNRPTSLESVAIPESSTERQGAQQRQKSNKGDNMSPKNESYAQLFSEMMGNNGVARKANLNLLDQNFQQLMEQNHKLEQEIRQMNTQFSQKQNERLAHISGQPRSDTPRTDMPLKQQPKTVLTPVTYNSRETTAQIDTTAASKPEEPSQNPVNMSQMEGDFDERCARTKYIVTQLAQRLHEVKRDTFTELDKIQGRKSHGTASNSNSRSPAPAAARQVPTIGSGEAQKQVTRQASKNSSQGGIVAGLQQQVSLKKLRNNSAQRNTSNDLSNSQVFASILHTRTNTNERFNVSQVMNQISPIRANAKNDVSVSSTTGGFNFRQLKPHDSSQTSFTEAPAEKVVGTMAEPTGQELLCFDNSPIRSSAQQRVPGRIVKKSIVNSGGRKSMEIDKVAFMGSGEQAKSTSEGLMNSMGGQKTEVSLTQVFRGQGAIAQQQQEQVWQTQTSKELTLAGQPAAKPELRSVSTPAQQLVAVPQMQPIAMGPERSPSNVTGNQLSNVLRQINYSAERKTDLPLQQQQPTKASESSQPTSPINAKLNNQTKNMLFLYQDQQKLVPIMEQRQQVVQSAKNIRHLGSQQESLNRRRVHVSLGDIPEEISHLRAQLMHNQSNEEYHSRQLNDTQGVIPQQLTAEVLSQSTYDRMHQDILHLQDKIKHLEAQMMTSPSVKNESHISLQQPKQQTVTLESVTNLPYKHDSKHAHQSSRQSILKMTVPKTVQVNACPAGTTLMASKSHTSLRSGGGANDAQTVKSNHQQDEKATVRASSRTSNRLVNSDTVTGLVGQSKNSSHQQSHRAKSRSQADNSLLQMSHKSRKNSAENLISVPATHREHNDKIIPLKCEISDLMSHSQPELRKSRRQQSAKTISRFGSRKSSKSPLSKSQKSSRKLKQASSKADQKSLKQSKHKHLNSTSSQINVQNQGTLPSKKSKTRKNNSSTLQGERFNDSTPAHGGVSFCETPDQIEQTRSKKRRKKSSASIAYEITDSGYTNEPSEAEELATMRDGTKSNNTLAQSTHRILQSVPQGDIVLSVDPSPNNNGVIEKHILSGGQCSMLDHNEDVGSSSEKSASIEKREEEIVSSSMSQNLQTAGDKKRSSLKQTYPLRVRKNQKFAKGPECASIPSSRTPAVDQLVVDEPEMSEQPQINSNNHRSLLGSMTQDNCSVSEMPSNTFQDDILREYENQIQQQVQPKPSRNQSIIRNLSELQQVQNGREVAGQMFEHPLKQGGPSGEVKYNATSFSNQTSRFQPLQMSQHESNSAYEDALTTPVNRSSLKGATPANVIEERGVSGNRDGSEHRQSESDENEIDTQYDPMDSSKVCLEQRLQKEPASAKEDQRRTKKDAKAPRKENMPLQRKNSGSATRDLNTAAKLRAAERSRIQFFEQRNRHLELELKRHQVHLAKSDEIHQKYKSLKVDYKQLLQSFERSEEIRREQKELINEQRSQLRNLKTQTSKQQKKIDELATELESVKRMSLTQSNENLQAIQKLPLSKSNRMQDRNAGRVDPNNTQPLIHSGEGYVSGSSQSHSETRPPSSQQISRSNLHASNQSYMLPLANSYGMSNAHIGELPLQQMHSYSKQSPMILSSYTAGGPGMLDLQNVASTEEFFVHDGYSVMHEQAMGGSALRQPSNGRKKRIKRNKSVTSDKSRKQKKNHKKKHRKRHRHNHDHSFRIGGDECQRSLSTSRRSTRNNSRSAGKGTSSGHLASRSYATTKDDPLNVSNLSMTRGEYHPRDSRRGSARRRSRSKKKLKSKHGDDLANNQSSSYIFNIQTSSTDQIKGVHKFQTGAKTSSSRQPTPAREAARMNAERPRSNSSRSRERPPHQRSNQGFVPFY